MSWIQHLFDRLGNLFKWYFIAQPWEQALRVRAGKYVRLYRGGIHFRIPFLDTIYIQNDRVRVSEIGSQTVTTRELKTITLAGVLRYKLKDIQVLHQTVHQPESTIAAHVHGLVSAYVTENELKDCVPAILMKIVTERLGLEEYGLEGVSYTITDFAVVKTYRFISGEIYKYTDRPLDTNRPLSKNETGEM